MEKLCGLECFTLGPWGTNCYLLSGEGEAALIDAGFDPEPMLDALQARGLKLTQVLLTHAHIDHIAGLAAVRERWPGVPILVHPDEVAFLTDPQLNLSAFLAEPLVAPESTGTLNHGDTLTLARATWHVRHTPGHSPGGVTFVQPESATAIVGDTLFQDSIGRTDFPTSRHADLMQSIDTQLLTLPDDTRILPGHGAETTVAHERAHNPFLSQ